MINKKGFTLIELMVVVLIIAVLAGIAVPQYTSSIEKARATEAVVNMKAISDSLNRYYAQRERYPSGTTEERIKALDIDVELPKYFSVSISNYSTVSGSVQGVYVQFFRTKNPIFNSDYSFSGNDKYYNLTSVIEYGKPLRHTCNSNGGLCDQLVVCTSNKTESGNYCYF
ncbi:type II secretion system protein G [Elusimicrobium posterum]|uniref:type IV pilin protein n=1 Tax=Elusimicrobium posterum TaxID=3116653 RepID=UPI003C72CBC2